MHFPTPAFFQKIFPNPRTTQIAQKVSGRSVKIHQYQKEKNLTTSPINLKTRRIIIQRQTQHRLCLSSHIDSNEPQKLICLWKAVKVKTDYPRYLWARRYVFTENMSKIKIIEKIKRRFEFTLWRRTKAQIKGGNAFWRVTEKGVYTTNK